MELPRSLAIAVLMCATVAFAPPVTAAPNDPVPRQEPRGGPASRPPAAGQRP